MSRPTWPVDATRPSSWCSVANLRPGDVLASTRAAGPRDYAPREVPGVVAIVANVDAQGPHAVRVTYVVVLPNGRTFDAATTWRATANLARLNIRDEDLTNLAALADDGTNTAADAANPEENHS